MSKKVLNYGKNSSARLSKQLCTCRGNKSRNCFFQKKRSIVIFFRRIRGRNFENFAKTFQQVFSGETFWKQNDKKMQTFLGSLSGMFSENRQTNFDSGDINCALRVQEMLWGQNSLSLTICNFFQIRVFSTNIRTFDAKIVARLSKTGSTHPEDQI